MCANTNRILAYASYTLPRHTNEVAVHVYWSDARNAAVGARVRNVFVVLPVRIHTVGTEPRVCHWQLPDMILRTRYLHCQCIGICRVDLLIGLQNVLTRCVETVKILGPADTKCRDSESKNNSYSGSDMTFSSSHRAQNGMLRQPALPISDQKVAQKPLEPGLGSWCQTTAA